jgi:uncharacterized protein (TIGR03437 family)
VNGTAAVLLYVQASQINLKVPVNAPADAPALHSW